MYPSCSRLPDVPSVEQLLVALAERDALIVALAGRVAPLWATGTARLLPYVVDGRSTGPVFLSSRPVQARRAPAKADIDPETGLARLSYARAAQAFSTATDGWTLHQLRHSALTHLAEDGVPLPLLMAKSRHKSLKTLQRYVRPSADAVAAMTAAHDPAPRR